VAQGLNNRVQLEESRKEREGGGQQLNTPYRDGNKKDNSILSPQIGEEGR
jgi:hypothetical protein